MSQNKSKEIERLFFETLNLPISNINFPLNKNEKEFLKKDINDVDKILEGSESLIYKFKEIAVNFNFLSSNLLFSIFIGLLSFIFIDNFNLFFRFLISFGGILFGNLIGRHIIKFNVMDNNNIINQIRVFDKMIKESDSKFLKKILKKKRNNLANKLNESL